jgi:hypothetical protein
MANDDYYNDLHQNTPHIKVQKENEYRDVQIKAINRALNILMSLLKYKGVINEHEVSWINHLKNNVNLVLTLDKEDLVINFLDLASRVACPKNIDDSIALIRNHKVIGPPNKKLHNPLTAR